MNKYTTIKIEVIGDKVYGIELGPILSDLGERAVLSCELLGNIEDFENTQDDQIIGKE